MSFATKDLLLIGAIVGGGYLILKTTKVGESLGAVGEGVGEGVKGVGMGLGTAGVGMGQAISDISGRVSSITGDVAELTAFVGEFGNWTAQQFQEMQASSLREHTQKDIIDRDAFKLIQEELARIQAELDKKKSEEDAEREAYKEDSKTERSRIIEDEKSQWLSRFTQADDKIFAMAGAVGGGLLSAWKYSPTGLLTSWITSQSSIQESVAPQQSAPSITSTSGILTGAVTTSLRTPTYSTSSSSSSSSSSSDDTTTQMLKSAGTTLKSTSDYLGAEQVTTGVYSEARPKYTAPQETSFWSKFKFW